MQNDLLQRLSVIPYALLRTQAAGWDRTDPPGGGWLPTLLAAWEADATSREPLRQAMQRVHGLVLQLESRPDLVRRGALQPFLRGWFVEAQALMPGVHGRGLWRRWEQVLGPQHLPEWRLPDGDGVVPLPTWASWPRQLGCADNAYLWCVGCEKRRIWDMLQCSDCGHLVCDDCHSPHAPCPKCKGPMRHCLVWRTMLGWLTPPEPDAPRPARPQRLPPPAPPPTPLEWRAALAEAVPSMTFYALNDRSWEVALQSDTTDEALGRLAATPALRQVSVLRAACMGLSDEKLAILLRSPYLEGLKRLYLNNNCLTVTSVEALRRQPLLRTLRELDLRDNPEIAANVAAARALLRDELGKTPHRSWLDALVVLRM